jgi:polar amino acid transport system substrate-binding protein
MKQIIQNYSTGKVLLTEVPAPSCSANKVIVRNAASLISIGTEKSIIELGRQNLLGKARQRPDLVRRFIEKARNEGLLKTFQEAMGRLDTPTPLGYSSAGVVIEVGDGVHDLSVGDRVSCIGAGYASHAEYIQMPPKLCVKLPENVGFEEAAFGMLGVIAMHGFRSAKLNAGETVAVIGLGLLGLLTIQILNAYGFKAFGYDIDSGKANLAGKLGAQSAYHHLEDFNSGILRHTSGYGADAVIITAATKSSDVVDIAVDIARFAGRVVVVGVADIHPSRNEMWHKEVEIVVSRAAGPGSLDPVYENKGIDFPLGYVRWTEQRNLEEFVYLLSQRRIRLSEMISHRIELYLAEQIYEDILANRNGPFIGVVVKYPSGTQDGPPPRTVSVRSEQFRKEGALSVGVIGAGLFGKALLLPALSKTPRVRLHTLSTATGAHAHHAAVKFGFSTCTTDYQSILENHNIDAVVVITPHHLHARMVIEALRREKHVFVEKPLCISETELAEIKRTYEENNRWLVIGYNRRFSPHARRAREALKSRTDPLVMNYRVNAGFIPPEHWVHSEEEGGSRIIGEMGHFLDMMQFLSGSLITSIFAARVSGNNRSIINSDNMVAILKLADGSVVNFLYSASGNRTYPRELIEVHAEGQTIVIDDFRTTRFFSRAHRHQNRTRNQQMGYKEELEHFTRLCLGIEQPLLSFEEIHNSTLATFKIEESLMKGTTIQV